MARKTDPYRHVQEFLLDLDPDVDQVIEGDNNRMECNVVIFDEFGRAVAVYVIPSMKMDTYISSHLSILEHIKRGKRPLREVWAEAEAMDGYLVYEIVKHDKYTWLLKGKDERYGLKQKCYINPRFVRWLDLNKYRIYINGRTSPVKIYSDDDHWNRIALVMPKIVVD